jgi:hypothetical protein
MQASGSSMPKSRGSSTKYRSILHAVQEIIQKEGVTSLYKGVGPTTGRASVVAAAELGYEHSLFSSGFFC